MALVVFRKRIRIGKEKFNYEYTDMARPGESSNWICCRGSDWCRPGERLALMLKDEYIVACDVQYDADAEKILGIRQQVFRILAADAPDEEGWHTWEANVNAAKDNDDYDNTNWDHTLRVQTSRI